MTPAIVVDTVRTLQHIHKALKTGDPVLVAAAESVLSGLIVHIKHEQALLDSRLRPYLDVLTNIH